MPKRRTSTKEYVDASKILPRAVAPSLVDIAFLVPIVVSSLDNSLIKQRQVKPDWKLYKMELRDNNPFIVREMCDRCGKVFIYPRWRKIREYRDPEIGSIYLESGVCQDCINASVYVDAYLDGDPLNEKDAKELFYKYARDYERAWRMVIAAAPRIALTEQEWIHRCKFFNGCAVCGAAIEVRSKYFPNYLNGTHSAWNIIPLCGTCQKRHYGGRVTKNKTVYRYRVFSTLGFFNKAKTIRMYLLGEMERHNLYIEPLLEYRKRFREMKDIGGTLNE